tara:strand:- start:1318 stop:1518 length:201 start_codon:yes stop_codon:yes gene_type:complete
MKTEYRMKLEYRNELTLRKLQLKERLREADFFEAIHLKDEILEIELELKEKTLFNGNTEDCENCGS